MKYVFYMALFCVLSSMIISILYLMGMFEKTWLFTIYAFIIISFIVFVWKSAKNQGLF